VTDDSAFKKQVRARMAETGEKYTVARREVIAGQHPERPPVVLRVYLNQHVDLDLAGEEAREYAAADEQGRREMANRLLADRLLADRLLADRLLADRLLADHIEAAGSGESQVTADWKIMTDQDPASGCGSTFCRRLARGRSRGWQSPGARAEDPRARLTGNSAASAHREITRPSGQLARTPRDGTNQT
jgi:hypothetical protein